MRKREPDGLDGVIEGSKAADPGFAETWRPFEIVIAMRDRRIELGLTQAVVAERMGVPTPRVCEIERNPSGVSFKHLARYAAAIGGEIRFVPSKAA